MFLNYILPSFDILPVASLWSAEYLLESKVSCNLEQFYCNYFFLACKLRTVILYRSVWRFCFVNYALQKCLVLNFIHFLIFGNWLVNQWFLRVLISSIIVFVLVLFCFDLEFNFALMSIQGYFINQQTAIYDKITFLEKKIL